MKSKCLSMPSTRRHHLTQDEKNRSSHRDAFLAGAMNPGTMSFLRLPSVTTDYRLVPLLTLLHAVDCSNPCPRSAIANQSSECNANLQRLHSPEATHEEAPPTDQQPNQSRTLPRTWSVARACRELRLGSPLALTTSPAWEGPRSSRDQSSSHPWLR